MYGHIVIIKRTGEDGGKYPLTDVITRIGRETICEIRILLPTVSRLHAEIRVDKESNEIWIRTISDKAVVEIADEPISAPCKMADGDVFTISGRKFRFEAVRNLSFDSDVTEVITPKRARYEASAMNTPIAKKHKAQAVKTRTPAHIKPISPSHAKAAPTGIPQALLEAIAKRRAKVDAEGVVQIVHARQLRTTSVVTPVDSSVAARPELATPIRKAIQARRKSITTAQHKPQFACEASSVHRGLPTPLRLAIHLRRKSFGGASRVACTSAIEDHDRMPLATLTNVDAKPEVSVQLGALKSRLRKAYTMVTESPQPEAKRVTRNSAKQMMIAQAYTVLPNSPCSVNRL